MTTIFKIVISGMLLLIGITSNSQREWKLEDEGTSVTFLIVEEEDSGSFEGLETKIIFSPDHPEKSSFSAKIPVKTINTGISQRDDHLRAKDFFYVEEYPHITFDSEEVIKTKSGYLAKGTLTMRGNSRDISMPFVWEEDKTRFVGRLEINSGKWGVPHAEEGEKQGNYKIVARIIANVK